MGRQIKGVLKIDNEIMIRRQLHRNLFNAQW